jgi:hypothetical protein
MWLGVFWRADKADGLAKTLRERGDHLMRQLLQVRVAADASSDS